MPKERSTYASRKVRIIAAAVFLIFIVLYARPLIVEYGRYRECTTTNVECKCYNPAIEALSCVKIIVGDELATTRYHEADLGPLTYYRMEVIMTGIFIVLWLWGIWTILRYPHDGEKPQHTDIDQQ